MPRTPIRPIELVSRYIPVVRKNMGTSRMAYRRNLRLQTALSYPIPPERLPLAVLLSSNFYPHDPGFTVSDVARSPESCPFFCGFSG